MASFVPTGKLVSLLKAADPSGQMPVSIRDGHRLGIGLDPSKPITVIDLSSEMIVPGQKLATTSLENGEASKGPSDSMSPRYEPRRSGRATGRYWYEINGVRTECSSVKELLLTALEAIEKRSPGALEKLFGIKKRTKRIVARDQSDLFDQKHLVEKHSERLSNGWWVGTNNSSEETKGWLRQAVVCARLTWGKDFRVSL